MKKLTLFSALAIMVATATLPSCSKVAKLLQYDIPLQTGSVTIKIPPTAAISASAIGTGTNTLNIDSVIKASTGNVLGVSNITSVKLTAASLTLQNPDSANNFQNFQSCYATFGSNSSANPYQVNIANNPNTYATTLTLPVDANAELKGYLTGTQFSYSVGGTLRTSTTDTLVCTLSFTFSMHVQG